MKNFSCRILVNDIIDQNSFYKKHNLISASKQTIFKYADIISLHTPLTTKTYHLINKQALGLMKKKPFIVNTSRGNVVKKEDLLDALNENKISGVALDVFDCEPTTDNPILSHPKVFCTPHIAGNSKEAVLNMGRSSIFHLNQFFKKNIIAYK